MNSSNSSDGRPLYLSVYLALDRCPHCSINKPNLCRTHNDYSTTADDGRNQRIWCTYSCAKCGGVVTAWCYPNDRSVKGIFPERRLIDESLPAKVASFLQQAIDCLHSPDGCVMLCASAIDEMLKARGYKDGNLYPRIKQATKDGVLTEDMSEWAHDVRLYRPLITWTVF
jgi:hypothetical protein